MLINKEELSQIETKLQAVAKDAYNGADGLVKIEGLGYKPETDTVSLTIYTSQSNRTHLVEIPADGIKYIEGVFYSELLYAKLSTEDDDEGDELEFQADGRFFLPLAKTYPL